MNWTDWIEALHPSVKEGKSSPNKPLLLIYLLARAATGCPNEVLFKDLESEFLPWLQDLVGSASPDVRLPFWHLQGDYQDSWQVEPSTGYEMQRGKNRPIKSSLLELGARGIVHLSLWNQVLNQRDVARDLAEQASSRWLPSEIKTMALARFDTYENSPSPNSNLGGSWTAAEFRPLVEAYIAMLIDELAGRPINKAKTRRALLAGPVQRRTEGAIERKMQNVSSVLAKSSFAWIRGYKPLRNTQGGAFAETVKAAAQAAAIPKVDEPTADLEELDQSVGALLQQPQPDTPPQGNLAPPRVKVSAQERVVRDPNVVAYVLRRAGGTCECCLQPAPFVRNKDQSPFLEVHHLERLADGGADTVANACAVCPNCHRELHLGVRAEELLERVRIKLNSDSSSTTS